MKIFGILLKDQQILSPDGPAIISKESRLSYSELEDKINQYSEHFIRTGIQRSDRCAILSENSVEYVLIILSLWNIGAVPVPLNVRLLDEEIKYLTTFAECRFLFIDENKQNFQDLPGTKTLRLPINIDQTKTLKWIPGEGNINDTAVIIFTSGSTGVPKGVMLNFSNLISSASAGDFYFNHKEDDKWLASLPFYHVGGFSILFRAFSFGASVIIPDSLRTDDVLSAVHDYNPSLISLVTPQLKRMIEKEQPPNAGLRRVLLGGGFLDQALVADALKRGWPAAKSYGSSETATFVTVLTPEEFSRYPASAGKALPGNKVFIVDEGGNLLPAGNSGEIAVSAGSVSSGYVSNQAETSNKFRDNIYYTGDFGRLNEEGFLFIEARRDDLIVSGGENVNPAEVESAIFSIPEIQDACVFGMDDEEWGQIVYAAVIKKSGVEINPENIKKILAGSIAKYKIPKSIFFLDDFPKTELGKVMKEKLKEIIRSKSIKPED